MKSPKRFF